MDSEKDVDVVEKTTPFQGHFRIDHYRIRHRLFGGDWTTELSREVFERNHAAGVLPYDPVSDSLVFVEQFRSGAFAALSSGLYPPGSSPWLVECPAGMIGPGETPEAVARREVQEETGCVTRDLAPVCRYLVSPGGASETVFLFCARVSAPKDGEIHGNVSEDEDIRVKVMPVATAFDRLERGVFADALTIIALQWFRLNHGELRRRWTTAP